MRIAFCTLGCKVNQYESQALSEIFRQRGHEIVSPEQKAEAFVVNSCTVTATGDMKSRKTVNHLRKNNPQAVIALIGCFPQAFPDKAKTVENADIVIGTKDKKRVVELVENCAEHKNRICDVKPDTDCAQLEQMSITEFDERTRAFVKIQDGCNRFCSYCIIPYARGRICSKPVEELKEEIRRLAKNGFSEIVLVGIDLSSYGKQLGKTLIDAVEAAAKIEGVRRIRLGSLEPEVISDGDIIRLSKIESFCPQFHLSLQSGCDETLKRMNRHYDSTQYASIVYKIRNAFPKCSVTTDVMVGFSGETEAEFQKSLDFVKKMRFLKVHVFPYSVRENTRAASFAGKINNAEKKKRAHLMSQNAEKIRKEILSEMNGREAEILVEGKVFGQYCMGYTKDYVPVYIKSSKISEGEFVRVRLRQIYRDGCLGEIL